MQHDLALGVTHGAGNDADQLRRARRRQGPGAHQPAEAVGFVATRIGNTGRLHGRLTGTAGAETRLDLEMSGLPAVAFDVRDAAGRSLPCKVQFRGVEVTPDPNMAVNDAHSVYGNGVGGWRMYLPSASGPR